MSSSAAYATTLYHRRRYNLFRDPYWLSLETMKLLQSLHLSPDGALWSITSGPTHRLPDGHELPLVASDFLQTWRTAPWIAIIETLNADRKARTSTLYFPPERSLWSIASGHTHGLPDGHELPFTASDFIRTWRTAQWIAIIVTLNGDDKATRTSTLNLPPEGSLRSVAWGHKS